MPATRKVYCSGPLFCPEEIAGMAAIASTVEQAGYRTFLPHRDGVEAWVMHRTGSALGSQMLPFRSWIDKAIFALDVFQLVEECDLFVFNMNGRVPDEGGVAESAMAFAIGKPVLIYRNDNRSAFDGGDNAMLSGLANFKTVNALEELAAALQAAEANIPSQLAVSEAMRRTVDSGRRVQTVLDRLPPPKTDASKQALLTALEETLAET